MCAASMSRHYVGSRARSCGLLASEETSDYIPDVLLIYNYEDECARKVAEETKTAIKRMELCKGRPPRIWTIIDLIGDKNIVTVPMCPLIKTALKHYQHQPTIFLIPKMFELLFLANEECEKKYFCDGPFYPDTEVCPCVVIRHPRFLANIFKDAGRALTFMFRTCRQENTTKAVKRQSRMRRQMSQP